MLYIFPISRVLLLMDYYTVHILPISPVLLPMDYYTVRIPYIASFITDGILYCTYSLYRQSYY